MDAAIARTVDHFNRPRSSETNTRRAALVRAIDRADAEQQRLVDAILRGAGDVQAVNDALRQRQEQLTGLRLQLESLTVVPMKAVDLDAVRQRLVDWRGLLRANTERARRVLAKLVEGRLEFTPQLSGQRQHYAFTGKGTIRGILEGIVDESITRCGVPNGIGYRRTVRV